MPRFVQVVIVVLIALVYDALSRSHDEVRKNYVNHKHKNSKALTPVFIVYNPIQSNEYNGSRPRPLFPSLSKI